jgi:hypothetical protein
MRVAEQGHEPRSVRATAEQRTKTNRQVGHRAAMGKPIKISKNIKGQDGNARKLEMAKPLSYERSVSVGVIRRFAVGCNAMDSFRGLRREIWFVVGTNNKRYRFLYIDPKTFEIGTRDDHQAIYSQKKTKCVSRFEWKKVEEGNGLRQRKKSLVAEYRS